MIRLPNESLPTEVQAQLKQNQREINQLPDYAGRVEAAARYWENRTHNLAFRTIRARLAAMCAGARRCCYCEDSCSDEIEHIWPKSLYPEMTFVWNNYLYACSICNVAKSNQFAVFGQEYGSQEYTIIHRNRGDSLVHPPKGSPVLINPRAENALEFMELDLVDTFFFLPVGEVASRNYLRADYTINRLLDLNRDPLPDARQEAYSGYRARLREYIQLRNDGCPQFELERYIREIRRIQHPTVWKEMQRQSQRSRVQTENPDLYHLFQSAPEALTW